MYIPLRGNSAYIMFISSERLGTFHLNFGTLILIFLLLPLKFEKFANEKLPLLVNISYLEFSHITNKAYRWSQECGYRTFPASVQLVIWNVSLHTSYKVDVYAVKLT